MVDVGGVGYGLTIPVSTFYRLGEPGTEVTLLTHTHVREDALALFGFLTAAEQTLFERLIAVAGVGPRLAIGILSGIETPDLVGALRSGDVARLTRIPGVGKKTAERLVVELKDKMAGLEGIETAPGEPAGGPEGGSRLGPPAPRATRAPRPSAAWTRPSSRERLPSKTFSVGPSASSRDGKLVHCDRQPPRHWPAHRRRPRVRAVSAPPHPRRVRRPTEGRRQPPRGHRSRPRPRRRPRPRPAVRAPRGWQDQPRPRPRRGALGTHQGHRRSHHRASGRPRRPPDGPRQREILFVDEIHRLDAKVEEILYPALEDYSLDLMIGSGPGARSMKVPLKPFTLVGGHHPGRPAHRSPAWPLRHRSPPRLLHRGGPRGHRHPLGAHPRRPHRRRRAPARSPAAAGAPPASPTDSSAACETSPRCEPTASITLAVAQDALALLEVDAHGFDDVDRTPASHHHRQVRRRPGGGERPRRRHQRGARRHRGHLRALPAPARLPRPHPPRPRGHPPSLRALRPNRGRRQSAAEQSSSSTSSRERIPGAHSP